MLQWCNVYGKWFQFYQCLYGYFSLVMKKMYKVVFSFQMDKRIMLFQKMDVLVNFVLIFVVVL